MTPEDPLELMLEPELLSGGNDVRLLQDGREAFPAMLEAIAGARHSVLVEMYTIASDRTGHLFAKALAERAKAGVPVRVLYDSAGSRETATSMFRELRSSGAIVTPFRPWGLYTWRKRDHRKLIVVDGRIGFVGGANLTDEYAPDGGNWRDLVVRIEGPEVADLVALFAEVWIEEEEDSLFPTGTPPHAPPVEGGIRVAVMGSGRPAERRQIERHYRHAMAHARRRIWIANAYFVPSRTAIRLLKSAARRGVDVRLLMPTKTDALPVYHAGRALFAGLLSAGVRIFEYQGRVLHAKMMTIDGAWSSVGSYNLDHLSLFHNYEIAAVVIDPSFGARLEATFEADLASAREIDREAWLRRPWMTRLLEQFFWQARSAL